MSSLSRAVARATHERPRLHRSLRALYRTVNAALPPRNLAGVPGRVHRNDTMLNGTDPASVTTYVEAGARAADLLEEALADVGRSWSGVGTILDFGCGHGRILRHLARRAPGAQLVGCDLDPEGVEFCAAEFGARPVLGSTDITAVDVPASDVIWLGSVFTHLDEPTFHATFAALAAALQPNGVMVLTLLGPDALGGMTAEFDWLRREAPALEERFARTGFAYIAYPHYDTDYGLAAVSEAFIGDAAAAHGLRVLRFQPAAWGSQDVVSLARDPQG